MHDYGCWPLWLRVAKGEIHENVDPKELGLSPSLVGRLMAWQAWGESRINIADPHDSRVADDVEDSAFDAEGRLLAERVRSEYTDATVSYWKDER